LILIENRFFTKIFEMRIGVFAVLFLLLTWGCEKKGQLTGNEDVLVVNETLFEQGVPLGELGSKELSEASGLAASANNPNLLWAHNDGGDQARLFLIDSQAHWKATVWFDSVENRDWEAMAVGPGPVTGKNYVYAGDIGDNKAQHKFKFIYRVEEPVVNWQRKSDTTITRIDRLKFQYPDGPRDAESLMVDPLTRDIYIISKREEKVNLYRLPYPQSTTENITAELTLAKLEFNQHEEKVYSQHGDEKLTNGYHSDYYNQIVSANISKDGSELLIKSYSSVYYWKRNQGESIADMIKRMPTRLPYIPEPQGEAITFAVNGKGYFTLNEKLGKNPQRLFFYKRK
jgi:hypothetical protein